MKSAMRYLKDVTTLALNDDACTGCGRCVEVCPHGVFEIRHGKAAIIDKDACMECGACSRNCAFGAIGVSAGVGCASGIIRGILTGGEPRCGCEDSSSCC